MKECPACSRCFPDQVNHCPSDGDLLKFTITGEPVLDGRYQLEKRLGQGGMGVVFKARHIFLKTQLAIKIILPDLVGNDPSLTTRFRQEAMAAAAVHHQNTIRVTDFGIVNGTMPFLVMEFIEGPSLHDILQREKRLAPARALEIMLAVCAGVSAAHEFGIVHRDLKPLNIIMQNGRPLSEGVKVLDFGLAKIKSGDLLGSFVAAQTQGMMGSPFYMAPEQWSDEEVDVRADIYSLGIILYQMLAGDVPFRGGSVPAIMKKHLIDPPAPLSERGVSVPPAVEAVVRHALEKEADHRPASVADFISELQGALAAVKAATASAEFGARTIQIRQNETLEQMRPQQHALLEEPAAPPLAGSETVASLPVIETGAVREESGANVPSPVTGRQPDANLTAAVQTDEASELTRLASSDAVQAEEKESARLRAEEQLRRYEAAERERIEREARQRAEAEERRRAEAQATEAARLHQETQETAERERLEAEASARVEAEARDRREAEEREQREAEEKAQREAKEKAEREAVEQQRRETEEKEQRAAAESARRAALEREQAEQAQREGVEQARLQTLERERREAEERERSVAAERQKREAEEFARREEEKRATLAAAAQKAELERQAAREKQLAKDASAGLAVQDSRDSLAQVSQTAHVAVPTSSSSSRAPLIALGAVVLLALLISVGGFLAYRAGFFGSGGNTNVANNVNTNVGTNTNAGVIMNGTATKPDLVQLPGGAFNMGRNDVPPISDQYAAAYLVWVYSQWPAHSVTVKPFAIDKTEVTDAEYAEFVKASGHAPPPDWNDVVPKAGEEQWPVRSVSFDDAQAFAAWRSQRDGATYRLPTEEEWEYAARGGGDAARMFPWGGAWKDGLANLNSESLRPVGSFHAGATPQGVEDMIGNVSEWTSSPAAMYAGNNRTKLADEDRGSVVVRGGSYRGKADGDKPFTATTRSWVAREVRDPTLGFRLVRAGQP